MDEENLRSLDDASLAARYNAATGIGYSETGVTEHDRYLTDVESMVQLRLMAKDRTFDVLVALVEATESEQDRERLGIAILEMVVKDRQDLWPALDALCRSDRRWAQAFAAAWVPKSIAKDMPLALRATVIHID